MIIENDFKMKVDGANVTFGFYFFSDENYLELYVGFYDYIEENGTKKYDGVRLYLYDDSGEAEEPHLYILDFDTFDNEMKEFSATFKSIGLIPGETYKYDFRLMLDGEEEVYTKTYSFDMPTARPDDFMWDIPKIRGIDIEITASEWNKFTANINAFLEYKGLDWMEFPQAFSTRTLISGRNVATSADGLSENEIVSVAITKPAIEAINKIVGREYMLYEPEKGEPVDAEFFNSLVEALNSIQ